MRNVLLTAYLLLVTSQLFAQNTPREAGIWFAVNGQIPFVNNSQSGGFFTNPTIEHAYYSFISNGVQSLAVFAEHVDETRERKQIWSDFFFPDKQVSYPATVTERLYMTTIGLETFRTLWTESDFRLAGGIGVGYGLGGATTDVHNDSTGVRHTEEVSGAEAGLLIFAALRVRYSVYTTPNYEVALALLGRYWSFPQIAPTSTARDAYNGRDTPLSEFGYLAGISVGF
jgi:hypothetical protein